MKKIIVLMMLFSITFINRITADGTDSSDSEVLEMDAKGLNRNEVERSLDYPIIEAVWHPNVKQVDVTLYNIGEAEVYIVNSQNQVISSTITQTDVPTTVNLNVNGGQGTYYIVVMSDNWYAEGLFTL